jgi:hypothetical protein
MQDGFGPIDLGVIPLKAKKIIFIIFNGMYRRAKK